MVGIGMGFAAPAAVEPNIEDTLFFASVEAMERDDLRVLAVLVTWFGVHARWVNADRLTRLVAAQGTARVRALWSALATWQAKDRRFAASERSTMDRAWICSRWALHSTSASTVRIRVSRGVPFEFRQTS
jgi:hypothetical protein